MATILSTSLSAKTIICYFSATGTTKALAEKTAKAIGADLHEIQPAQTYSSDDLNWHNSKSRSSIESNDPKSRPAIANKVDLTSYDAVILAYPIWWGLAPKILYTFVEQNNLNGKKVVALVTSGGSELGRSGTDLCKYAKGSIYKGGKDFTSGSAEEIKKFVEKLLK